MSIRSAVFSLGFMVFFCGFVGGCTHDKPPKPGDVIVRSDKPPETKTGLVEVLVDGKYVCFKEGVEEPMGTYDLKKGDMIGFETQQSDEGRGRLIPVLYGVAGSERFVLPLGDKYVWKRL